MRLFTAKLGVAAAAAAAVLFTSGCAVSLDTLPLPAPGLGGGTYTLTAVFSNALNLPTKAKVKLNGADIGEVESMTAKNYTALVHMRIRDDVRLPVGSTAELRSATPMGDVFVALTPPAAAAADAPALFDGATIPLGSTSAAATIEEVLTRASLLVNGGAIESLTRVADQLGEEVGGRGDRLSSLIDQTQTLVNGLAARTGQIREVLSDTAKLSATLAAQQSSIDDTVAAAGPALDVIGENTDQIIDLVGRLNTITSQLAQFPSIKGTNNRSLMAEVNLMAKDLNDAALNPNANLSSLNAILPIVLKVTDGSSAHVDADVVQLIGGGFPDPNFPGESGARLPEGSDWTNFVGSLEYFLNKLKDKVIGPPR